MKPEEFERLKEEEKKHLREIRNLKQRLKDAQRMQRLGKAVSDIQSAGDLQELDSSVEELQRRAAEQEARLDLVIESAQSTELPEIEEIDEDALKAARAADFIRQMKLSMGESDRPVGNLRPSEPAEAEEAEQTEKAEKSAASETPAEESSDFEKTIGRMTPRSPSSR